MTKYPYRKMIKFAFDGISSFSTVPLKLATWTGYLAALLAVLYLLSVFIQKLLGYTVEGWATIMVAMLFLGSVQLICLGILGEYLGASSTRSSRGPCTSSNTSWSRRPAPTHRRRFSRSPTIHGSCAGSEPLSTRWDSPSRWVGRVQLGANWSDIETAEVLEKHSVVSQGIYRYIRHPIYVGDLILLIGLELALNPWLVLGALALVPVVLRQAVREEQTLVATLPGYADYCARTKRFIPFVA